ncbi:hypothetical protein B296_00049551 [Ensete ventricosum]|uniref:Uncharacterized protein n=1 Tax=Ensete ventricosum TaxID=4639 RepID=A0A426X5X9_ENSVE|nr:hypothetical protein B296_00049551 [Ensete ventricosum]
MLRPGVTQEWVEEGELPRERIKKIGDSGGPMMCMIRAARELDCFSAHIRLREPDKSEDEVEYANIATKEARENRIAGIEAGGRKGRESDDEYSGAQLPKSKVSVRKEVDSEERHSAAKADLLIAKEGMKMQGNG